MVSSHLWVQLPKICLNINRKLSFAVFSLKLFTKGWTFVNIDRFLVDWFQTLSHIFILITTTAELVKNLFPYSRQIEFDHKHYFDCRTFLTNYLQYFHVWKCLTENSLGNVQIKEHAHDGGTLRAIL